MTKNKKKNNGTAGRQPYQPIPFVPAVVVAPHAKQKNNKPKGKSRWEVNVLNGNSVNLQRSRKNFFPSGGSKKGNQFVIIEQDEYVTDVQSSSTFTAVPFAANPGLSSFLPWGSLQAPQYAKYRVIECVPYYKPIVSAFSPAGQQGKVMLSFQFDASMPPPASKQQVEDTFPHSDCMAYEQCSLPISAADTRMQDSYYIRSGGIPITSDIKTYDFGNLFVSTIGMDTPDPMIIGELRMRYKILLFEPVLRVPTLSGTSDNNTPFSFCCWDAQQVDLNPAGQLYPDTDDWVDMDPTHLTTNPCCVMPVILTNPFFDVRTAGCYFISANLEVQSLGDLSGYAADFQIRDSVNNVLCTSTIGSDATDADRTIVPFLTCFNSTINVHGFKFVVRVRDGDGVNVYFRSVQIIKMS